MVTVTPGKTTSTDLVIGSSGVGQLSSSISTLLLSIFLVDPFPVPGASTVASATAPAVVLTAVSAVVSARIAAVESTGYEVVGGRGSVHQSPTLNSVLETLQLMRRQCAQMLTATGEDQVKTAHLDKMKIKS